MSIDLLSTSSLFKALNLTAARVKVADNVAHIFLGNDDGNFHYGFEENRIGLLGCILECHRTCNLECHFRRVNLVIRSVVKSYLYVNNRITGNNARLHSTLNTLVSRFDVFLRNSTADDVVYELIALIGVRFNVDLNVTVLTFTA